MPYHLQPNYTRNKSMVCTGTPEKMKKRKKQNTKKEKKGKYTEIEGNEERKRSKQALRAQAESLGDQVDV